MAIATGAAGQRENAVLEIEVIYLPSLAQPLGNLFGFLMFSFERVDQIQSNEVGHFDFDWHGAAVCGATVAHACLVAGPTFGPVDVNDADGRFHRCCISERQPLIATAELLRSGA